MKDDDHSPWAFKGESHFDDAPPLSGSSEAKRREVSEALREEIGRHEAVHAAVALYLLGEGAVTRYFVARIPLNVNRGRILYGDAVIRSCVFMWERWAYMILTMAPTVCMDKGFSVGDTSDAWEQAYIIAAFNNTPPLDPRNPEHRRELDPYVRQLLKAAMREAKKILTLPEVQHLIERLTVLGLEGDEWKEEAAVNEVWKQCGSPRRPGKLTIPRKSSRRPTNTP
jgi:hypothetical protein